MTTTTSMVSSFSSMSVVIPTGVPPGLEFLLPTDQIIVKEIRKGFFSTSYAKEYDIFDAWGRRMYSATETTYDGCCNAGTQRNWNIDIFNCMGQSVISGIRTGGGCCEHNEVLVTSNPTGLNLGGVSEMPGFFGTSWDILNGAGAPVLLLDAPFFSGGGLFEREFPLYDLKEPRSEVGMITKKFTGFFSTEDVFGVKLPVNLDVKLKAVLIYATFLIDFQFYIRNNN